MCLTSTSNSALVINSRDSFPDPGTTRQVLNNDAKSKYNCLAWGGGRLQLATNLAALPFTTGTKISARPVRAAYLTVLISVIYWSAGKIVELYRCSRHRSRASGYCLVCNKTRAFQTTIRYPNIHSSFSQTLWKSKNTTNELGFVWILFRKSQAYLKIIMKLKTISR